MSSQSSNAILAKARAMYGKSLKESDYDNLIECKSVAELAAYLKQRTNYAAVMSGLNETETDCTCTGLLPAAPAGAFPVGDALPGGDGRRGGCALRGGDGSRGNSGGG